MKLINTESTRSYYAPFETIDQLNANTKAIREQHAEFMTSTEKAVLDVLHRFASKHYGVCYLSKSSIAEMVGISRRQVIRICNKFVALGLIVQYETDRKAGGGQTSNTIVFLTQLAAKDAFVADDVQQADNMRNEGDVTPAVTGLEAPKDAQSSLSTNDTDARVANKDGLVTKLPKTLQYALAPFFDTDELYTMAGVVFKAKSAIDKDIQIEDHENEYYNAIVSVINAFKRGEVRNFAGLLYSAVRHTTRIIDRKVRYGF